MQTNRLAPATCPAAYPHLAHNWRAPDAWSRCPGIVISPELRANPTATRRHVVAELRSVKGFIAHKISRWAITGTELDDGRMVPRRVDELPENSGDAWTALARTCRDAAADLLQLAGYADERGRGVIAHEQKAARTLRAGKVK